jgi:N-dimethylarginine dimethylaminohydrolase
MAAIPLSELPRQRFLVCPPRHFEAHFLFNPFMAWDDRIDRRRALAQWRRLVSVLEQAGADVEIAEPSPVSGQLPFTADGALVYAPGRAFVLRNDGLRGDLEPPVFREWLERLGLAAEALPPGHRVDGGNLLRLPTGDVLAGLKPGAPGFGERYVGKILARHGRRLCTVPLVDGPFLHLDTVVGVLGRRGFLVHRDALADGLPEPLAGAEILDVSRVDAERFACNVVVVGDVVVTGLVSDRLAQRIGRLGFEVERLDLREFHKAGGGAKCLTLPLNPHV